MEQQVRMIGD